MLVPMACSVATTTGMAFIRTSPFTPETDTLVVARILATGQTSRALELALPTSVKALTPIGILVPEESLLTDANGPISFVVISHHHFGTSPERGRVTNSPSSSCNPVYERLYHSCVSSSHFGFSFRFLIFSAFLCALNCWLLLISKRRANQRPLHENTFLRARASFFSIIEPSQMTLNYCLQ